MNAFQQQIAEREAELHGLEELKRQVAATESRPAELRDEIATLRRQEQEHVGAAITRYVNFHAPFVEARDEALALVSTLADAIEKARDAYGELDAAYRAVVNLGIEPEQKKPDRSDLLMASDRALQNEFDRLRGALGSRW